MKKYLKILTGLILVPYETKNQKMAKTGFSEIFSAEREGHEPSLLKRRDVMGAINHAERSQRLRKRVQQLPGITLPMRKVRECLSNVCFMYAYTFSSWLPTQTSNKSRLACDVVREV